MVEHIKLRRMRRVAVMLVSALFGACDRSAPPAPLENASSAAPRPSSSLPVAISGSAASSAVTLATTTGAASLCTPKVGAVVSAKRFRGPGPMTPATLDMLKDQNYARTYWGRSHGDEHIQCVYRVALGGRDYRYLFVIGNTFGDLDESACATSRPKVATEIIATTNRCTDLHAGEYWGHVLIPEISP